MSNKFSATRCAALLVACAFGFNSVSSASTSGTRGTRANSANSAASQCVDKGYTVALFTGQSNSPKAAHDALGSMRALQGSRLQSEPIQYEVFYSQTESGTGATLLEDIGKVFVERTAEIDPSGALGMRWEYFWEILSGERVLTQKLQATLQHVNLPIGQLQGEVNSKITGAWSQLRSHPLTAPQYTHHLARLSTLHHEQQKLLLVGYSHGNLFVNQAYDYLSAKGYLRGVSTLHIAPASPDLRGMHVLADSDQIIQGRRELHQEVVADSNVTMQPSMSDPSGHGLAATYLDALRPASARIYHLMTIAMQNTLPPNTRAVAGAFSVSLHWDGPGDLDLHVYEASGTHVFYNVKGGRTGLLDLEDVDDFGPEHYYAVCRSDTLRPGNYRFAINNYVGAEGRMATIQVASATGGTVLSKTLKIGADQGNNGDFHPVHAFNVQVNRDPFTEEYSYSAD